MLSCGKVVGCRYGVIHLAERGRKSAMEVHEASVADIIAGKLRDDNVPDRVAWLVLDAMRGSASEVQGGDAGQPAGPRRVYLDSISVEGFRGIGPKATLYLTPGPGLTVVTGRNGSGKSSFAEAAELALTGENKRWEDRTAVWKEGWRNLHTPKREPSAIAVRLTEDGAPGITTVTRDWAPGAVLGSANEHVRTGDPDRPGGTELSLADKGWARPLELYRPFLSYSELGALVSGRPSSMHDAMQAILGLDLLTSVEKKLTEERRCAEADAKAARNELPALLAKLAAHPDERARLAENAIGGRTRDLAALDALIVAGDTAGDGLASLLKEVAAITLPAAGSVSAGVDRLAAARAAVAALAGTRAADARRLAGLLTAAVEHQRSHAGEPCPVCGGRVLDEAWAAAAKDSIAELTDQAAGADAASAGETAAAGALGRLVPPKPAVLRADLGPGLDPAAASAAWDRWASAVAAMTSAGAPSASAPSAGDEAPSQASAIMSAFESLSTAVTMLRSSAERALQDRAAAWHPLARDLAAWSELARKEDAASVRANDLRKAVDWLRATGKEVRNARLAPFARTSAEVWETLRQESNVELGPITLAGSGPMRKVTLDVTVDGVPGAALSVMSQGELHALGLALFLPRATATDSPFGFVIIDDPVQAMDPAKVDGLARVLSSVAAARQVVVFTHDDRLPAALRQLQLPATVLAVTRRERSVVTVRQVSDPVKRYLEDARALAKTAALPEGVRAVAVAGLCRGAIEAACVEVVRSRGLRRGVAHAVVEEWLDRASHSLQELVALALLGSASRAAEVPAGLRALGGPPCANAFWDAKKGVHDPQHGDLKRFIDDTELLAKALRR
jgi:recombinational DNA repair ATPase RecF